MALKKYSNWIWNNDYRLEDEVRPITILFRKTVNLDQKPVKAKLQISADSRYKLYVNEILAEVGPQKGDGQIWYVDHMDITSYLKKGSNVLSAVVLHFPQKPSCGNQSIISTATPGLYLAGGIELANHRIIDISADDTWKTVTDHRVRITPGHSETARIFVSENVKADSKYTGWMRTSYDDTWWEAAKPYDFTQIRSTISPGYLEGRTIPFMFRKKLTFQNVMTVREGSVDKEAWLNLIRGTQPVVIPAEEKVIVELDAGEEMCGYLKLKFTGGKNAKITMIQSEAYFQEETCEPENFPIKADREDYINGHLEGPEDHYIAAGDGTEENPECIEPFWFRTFRFIQLTIKAQKEPVMLHSFDYEETGYPLEVKSHVQTSDDSLKGIWDISRRTLQRCMFETYVDCPFYEQLQYAMDVRAQILYTYASAADDRLARQCMDDFRRSQRFDGLICSAYPSNKPNVIPGFSLFYVWMLYDHMMYFGDKDFLHRFMPSVEQILQFFERHLTEKGYVGKVGGLLYQEQNWSFIDWAKGWEIGVPEAGKRGALTMENLLYINALQQAVAICEYLDRNEQAAAYEMQAGKVKEAVRTWCTGADGMIQDGPGVDLYSQHCQVFAVLTGTVTGNQAKENLLKTLQDKEKYPQCTVAMCLYLFRALEMAGLYDYVNEYWNIWRGMIANHMTTVAESDMYCRSECHAWGAVALYELPSVVLGVRPAKPGFAAVRISPIAGHLDWAKGEAITPKGMVKVAWEKDNQEMKISFELPDGLEVL